MHDKAGSSRASMSPHLQPAVPSERYRSFFSQAGGDQHFLWITFASVGQLTFRPVSRHQLLSHDPVRPARFLFRRAPAAGDRRRSLRRPSPSATRRNHPRRTSILFECARSAPERVARAGPFRWQAQIRAVRRPSRAECRVRPGADRPATIPVGDAPGADNAVSCSSGSIRCDQSSPGWIQMDVIADRPQVFARARIHQDSLVAPAENVTPQLMPAIVALRVCSKNHFIPGARLARGVSITTWK